MESIFDLGKLKGFWRVVVNNNPGKLTCPNGVIYTHTLLEMDVFDDKGKFVRHEEVKDRCITNSFVNLLVDRLQATSSDVGQYLHNLKYHQSGSGSTGGESATDTGLVQSSSANSTMNLGSSTEATDGANYYKSVATITYTTTSTGLVINEHGIFTATSSTNGILADRTVFAAITVQNGWSIQFSYSVSFTAGG